LDGSVGLLLAIIGQKAARMEPDLMSVAPPEPLRSPPGRAMSQRFYGIRE
jgi:hypothetical protein